MCEYLFRGKRLDNGEWVEGFYVCLNSKSHRIYDGYAATDCGDYYPAWFEVIPETVGQYTGLTDKNGVKIFEGDIVKYKTSTPNLVIWDADSALFVTLCRVYGKECYCTLCGAEHLEVIGNIHDNPELLGGGEE